MVPTVVVQRKEELHGAVSSVGPAVVKPCVGAGGRGVVVLDGSSDAEPDFGSGPWVVQPLVESVRTEGETSVFVLDGEVVSQAQKVPAKGEIRVHESYGGTTVAVAGLRRGGRPGPSYGRGRRRHSWANASTTRASTRCGSPTAPWR